MMIWAGGACCPLTSAVKFGQSKLLLSQDYYTYFQYFQEVPAKQFREWDKHFSRLIWNN